MILLGVTPDQILYGYGPLGIAAVILSGAVYKLFNIIIQRLAKAENDVDEMVRDVFTKVLPALDRNNQVLLGRQDLDRELIDALKENTKVLQQVIFLFDQFRGASRTGGP